MINIKKIAKIIIAEDTEYAKNWYFALEQIRSEMNQHPSEELEPIYKLIRSDIIKMESHVQKLIKKIKGS